MKIFKWNEEKNNTLKSQRNISFEKIVWAIEQGSIIDIQKHINEDKYRNQFIYYILINEYIWVIPVVEKDEEIFIKTAFPSRKATKDYLRRLKNEL
jgi:uncharacterized DUF497 family protein